MRTRRFMLAAALCGLFYNSASNAGLDTSTELRPISDYELVVMEAPGCTYCALFRRDVLPSYELSERSKEMPIRFLDINEADENALGLDGPVDVVPTFVVLHKHKEIGRIPGYLGAEFFFHSINHLMSSAP